MEPGDARSARAAALNSLARRDHASGELRRKLLRRGFEAALIERVIEDLLAEGLLDDRRFVENFIAYHAQRGHGPLRVRADLRAAGLEGALVEEGLEAYPDWLAQLRQARRKKFGDPPPEGYEDRRRQARFLSYRGFTGAQIRTGLGFDTDLDIE